MEKKSDQELSMIISRVMAEVNQEVKSNEATFKVADLQSSLGEFVKSGGSAAWTISYSTSKSEISREDLGGLGKAAWTISYSTSKSADIVKGGIKE